MARLLSPMQPFMGACELSERLNPYVNDGITMIALVPFGKFPHIKSIPAYWMMVKDFVNGKYDGKDTVVIDSSGNTAHAVALLAPAFGFKRTKVILSTDVPDSKVSIFDALASNVEVIKVSSSVAARAIEEGEREGHIRINQYAHMANMEAHEKFTANEIKRVIGADVALVAVALGSGGTAAGVGKAFPGKVIGVRPVEGEQVPGARSAKRMAEVVRLPWKEHVPKVVEVSRKASFIASRRLTSEVVPAPGPTSGMAYQGLCEHLWSLGTDELSALRGKKVAFICPDDARFYSVLYKSELDPDQGMISD